MVRHVAARYPTTKIICIGFSMGGNIVTKYLGERKSIPQIIAGISACQVIKLHLSMESGYSQRSFNDCCCISLNLFHF